MANLSTKEPLIQVRIRTINSEYTLPVEESRYLLEKIDSQIHDKSLNDKWIERDVNNSPDPGDINPDFIRGTFRILLEKQGYEIESLGQVQIGNNEAAGKGAKVMYINFYGKDKFHLQEKSVKMQQSQTRIKKRKDKEKKKRKARK